MDSLRWKYGIQAYVEETGSQARSRGFSVIYLEGQSRTGQLFPLNQVEIKGGDFDSDVRVIVGPQVTQIYFSIKEIPSMEGLGYILDNLEKVEQILNEVVIFAPNEIARFNMETRKPVMSIGMLKTQFKLNEEFHRVLEKVGGLVLREFAQAFVYVSQGKIGYALKRMDALSSELLNFQRDLIRMAKEQGIEEADKWESELLESERFEAELASARSPIELRNLLEKYWSKGSDFGD